MLGKIKPDLQQNLFKTRLTELINIKTSFAINEVFFDVYLVIPKNKYNDLIFNILLSNFA